MRASCSAVSDTSCPIEISAFESADQRGERTEDPDVLARQVDARRLADAERRGAPS